jgi:hypothetical protein
MKLNTGFPCYILNPELYIYAVSKMISCFILINYSLIRSRRKFSNSVMVVSQSHESPPNTLLDTYVNNIKYLKSA